MEGKTRIRHIGVLVVLQLRGLFIFSFRKNKKETLLKLFFYVLGIAAMTGLLFLVNFFLEYFHVLGMNPHLPLPLWNVVFLAFSVFAFLSTLFRINDSLFYSKDNEILLAYPVPAEDVFLSKIIFYGIQELVRSLFFLFPLLSSIGISYGMGAGYYFYVFLATIVLSLLCVSVSSVLSLPLFHVRRFFARFPLLQSLLFLALLIAITALVFLAMNALPENLALIEKWGLEYFPAIVRFTRDFSLWLYPFSLLSMAAVGYIPWESGMMSSPNPFSLFPILALLGVILLTAGCLVGAYFLSKKTFPALALKSQEFDKKETIGQGKKNHSLPGPLSHVKREVLVGLRDYKALGNYYLLFIVTPLAILILNSLFHSMRKSYSGEILTLFFNGLIMSLIALASNVTVSSLYSKEGQAGVITHSFPEDTLYAFMSRLFLRAIIMTASLIFSVVIYARLTTLDFVPMIPLFFCVYLLYLGHLLWSAELDIMHPKLSLYAKVGNKTSFNANELKSMVFALLFAFLFAGLLLFFMLENSNVGIYHLLAFSGFFFVGRTILFIHKVRAYGLLPYEGRGRE